MTYFTVGCVPYSVWRTNGINQLLLLSQVMDSASGSLLSVILNCLVCKIHHALGEYFISAFIWISNFF